MFLDFNFFALLKIVNTIIVSILSFAYLNQLIHLILSIFLKAREYKETKNKKVYGYLIAARNEEDNIKNIIDSIKMQNYDKDKMHIFVVADNCSDRTKDIALKSGAIVIERNDLNYIGKSYALEYAFNVIFKEYNNLNIDAFFIFDADNTLDKNYTCEMNKAYNEGYEIITSMRLPKNFEDSCFAGGSSYMFLRECRQIHNNRSRFNISTYVSGTGYLISSKILQELKYFPFHTLVEDVELSAYMASRGTLIAYCSKAKFYDKQPKSFKAFWIQRLRWCKGTHQVFKKEGKNLIKNMFKGNVFSKWGMFVHTVPLPALSFIWFILYFFMGLVYFIVSKTPFDIYLHECLLITIKNLVYPLYVGLILGIILMIESWNMIDAKKGKKILYAILFPFTLYLFLPITVCALFMKVKWKPTNQIK